MPIYKVTVSRAYDVIVKARNKTIAAKTAEFFIGNPPDESRSYPDLRRQFGFTIQHIEMVENDAIRVEESP